MHIKDLESVFNAQTPWKSDLKHVRATAYLGVEHGRKVEPGVRSPNLLVLCQFFKPPVIYERPLQLMGNDNVSKKQHQEGLSKSVFPTTTKKTRICYTSSSKWRKSTDFECDKNITMYCHFFHCLLLIFLSVTSR